MTWSNRKWVLKSREITEDKSKTNQNLFDKLRQAQKEIFDKVLDPLNEQRLVAEEELFSMKRKKETIKMYSKISNPNNDFQRVVNDSNDETVKIYFPKSSLPLRSHKESYEELSKPNNKIEKSKNFILPFNSQKLKDSSFVKEDSLNGKPGNDEIKDYILQTYIRMSKKSDNNSFKGNIIPPLHTKLNLRYRKLKYAKTQL